MSSADRIRIWRNDPRVFVREVFGATPDPWQDEVLRDFPTTQRQAMKASKGPGKVFPKSLMLHTPLGLQKWGDLKKGDYVFAVDGSPTKITEIHENGVVQQFKVTFDDGSFTCCGAEHPWYVRGQAERTRKHKVQYQRETQSDEIWVELTTQQIIDRGVRVKNGKWSGRQFEIPLHGPVQFDNPKSLLVDPYLLGVWLGDGCRNTGLYSCKSAGEIEEEIQNRGYKIKRTSETTNVYGLITDLRTLGILECYSYQKYIPEDYKLSSIQNRKDVLTGLMDTDGCIGKDGHMEFDSTSKRLADDVVWLVRSLGGNAFIKAVVKKPYYYAEDGSKIAGRDCYRVSLRTTFCPFKLQKKAIRWKPALNKSQLRYFKRYIDRIEPAHFEDSMCIQIEHPSRLYLANDFIVTHNSCIEAWLAWNFLVTRPHPKIAATSISGDNLRDGLWSEMAKWQQKSPLLKEQFVWQKERIFRKEFPETWFMSARNWSKSADVSSLGNTLAGLHQDYIMFILDESGGIPDAIMASAEAALSSCVEGHIVQAGNPTHLDGPLYRACTLEKRLWSVYEITGDPDDPKRSPRVSTQWAHEQIEKYGRDNPWVLVNVFGRFPPASLNALIGPDDIAAAIKRRYRDTELVLQPRVLGVDVARYGDDCFRDDTEILTNQGWKLFQDLTGAEKVLSLEKDKSSWEMIDEIVSYDFEGTLNQYESRSLNFSITDNHRLLVKKNPKSLEYKFTPYKELPGTFIIREQSGWSGVNPETITFTSEKKMPNGGTSKKVWNFDYNDWASFLGWFVSEGNVYREKRRNGRLRIIIAQNPGWKQEVIKTLLTKMSIKWRLCDNKKQIEFSNNIIGAWLIQHCLQGAHNKKVPKSLKDSSEKALQYFLNSFNLGDGTQHKNGTGRSYITSSKILADDLQEMLAKLGHAGSLRLKEKAGSTFMIGNRQVTRKHDTYVLYERSSVYGKSVTKAAVKKVPYLGKIWCVRTKLQSIYVRRKGVPMWSGNSSIIFPRQGLQAFNPEQYRGIDGTEGAERIMYKWNSWQVDGCFIDNTGGFGASWLDNLSRLGKSPVGINFSSSPIDPQYFNKRAEMAFNLVQWIKNGGAIPDIKELTNALIKTTYTFKGDKLIIEPKDDLKIKLGHSPDHMDALMLTFAYPVEKSNSTNLFPQQAAHQIDYNPFSRDRVTNTDTSAYVYNPRF